VDTPQTITHLSLCSGYGGIDLGLRSVLPELRTCTYVEIEAFPIANLVAKMQEGWLDVAPIWSNLKTFDARPFRGKVDILSGGFPCQPFSHAGQRKGTDDPRHLFPEIERVIRECEPRMLFLENVEGIIHAKYGGTEQSVLHHVLGRLESMGYRAEAGLFSAEECLYPHRRKRIFIAGLRNTYYSSKPTLSKHDETSGLPKHRELADTRRNERGGRSSVGGEQESNGRETSQGQTGCEGRQDKARKRSLTESSDECAEVGNTKHDGSYPKKGHATKPFGNQQKNRISERRGCSGCEYPSGPREPPKPWEYPRTIGDEEIIESLGGSDYGSADGELVRNQRTDSLRALGNGVVPATASRAFVILMDRLGGQT